MTDAPAARRPLPGGTLDPQAVIDKMTALMQPQTGGRYLYPEESWNQLLDWLRDALRAAPPASPAHLGGEGEPCETCGSRLATCECPAPAIPEAGGDSGSNEGLAGSLGLFLIKIRFGESFTGSETAAFRAVLNTAIERLHEAAKTEADLDRLRAELARVTEERETERETVANVSDAVAEHCSKHGEADFRGAPLELCVQILSRQVEAAQAQIATLQQERDNLVADVKWRHRWHDKLGRGRTETEGKFYERWDARTQALQTLSATWKAQVRAGANDEKGILDCAFDLDALAAGARETLKSE